MHTYSARSIYEYKAIVTAVLKKDKGAFINNTTTDQSPILIKASVKITPPEFKYVCIAGGRDFDDRLSLNSFCDKVLSAFISKRINIVVVSGACDRGTVTHQRIDGSYACGADGLGEAYAEEREFDIMYFPADWERHGKAAGFIRNTEMSKVADVLIAAWDNKSKGTRNMIKLMQESHTEY